MTSTQVVETSVTNNGSFQNYTHLDDHTIRTTDTPGFKPFTIIGFFLVHDLAGAEYSRLPTFQVTGGFLCAPKLFHDFSFLPPF